MQATSFHCEMCLETIPIQNKNHLNKTNKITCKSNNHNYCKQCIRRWIKCCLKDSTLWTINKITKTPNCPICDNNVACFDKIFLFNNEIYNNKNKIIIKYIERYVDTEISIPELALKVKKIRKNKNLELNKIKFDQGRFNKDFETDDSYKKFIKCEKYVTDDEYFQKCQTNIKPSNPSNSLLDMTNFINTSNYEKLENQMTMKNLELKPTLPKEKINVKFQHLNNHYTTILNEKIFQTKFSDQIQNNNIRRFIAKSCVGCPHCEVPIFRRSVRYAGCDTMRCTNCGRGFNYTQGKNIKIKKNFGKVDKKVRERLNAGKFTKGWEKKFIL